MWRRVWALTVKELIALLKDKRARAVLVVPPIVQVLVYGYAASFDLERVPFAVYQQDRSIQAEAFLAGLRGSPHFQQVLNLQRHAQIAAVIDAREALLVVHIGSDFSRRLLSGNTAEVQIIIDGRNSNTALIALNYLQAIIADFNRRWSQERGLAQPPAQLILRAWFNPNLISRWFFVPGIIGLITLLVTTMVTALSVAREREQGTFDQLLVTPLTPLEILLGKALPGLLIGFLEASLIVSIALFWFGIPLRGELTTLYFGMGVFVLSAIGVGLMISAMAATQQQGLLGAFLFMVPAVILSGFSTPIANMPEFVQYLTLLNPLRYFMVVLRGVFLEGTPFALLIDQFWPMAIIGVISLAFAGWLFRRRLY